VLKRRYNRDNVVNIQEKKRAGLGLHIQVDFALRKCLFTNYGTQPMRRLEGATITKSQYSKSGTTLKHDHYPPGFRSVYGAYPKRCLEGTVGFN